MANKGPEQFDENDAHVIMNAVERLKSTGLDDQGNPIDTEAANIINAYKHVTSPSQIPGTNVIKQPDFMPIEGIDADIISKLPIKSKESEMNSASLGKNVESPEASKALNVAEQVGGFATGVSEALNPLALPRSLETLGRAALEVDSPKVKEAKGLWGKITTALEEADKKAIIPSISVGEVASGIRTASRKVAGDNKSLGNIYNEELDRQGQYNRETASAQMAGGLTSAILSLGSAAKDLTKIIAGKKLSGVAKTIAGKNAYEATKPTGKLADQISAANRGTEIGTRLLDEGIVTASASAPKMLEKTEKALSNYGEEIGYFAKAADKAVARDSTIRPISVQQLESDIQQKIIAPLSQDPSTVGAANQVQDWIDKLKSITKGGDVGFEQAQAWKTQVGKTKAKFGKGGDSISKDAFQELYTIINKHIENGIESAVAKGAPEIDASKFVQAKDAYRDLKDAQSLLKKRVATESKNRKISLTDYMTGIGGMVTGGGLAGPAGVVGGAALGVANKLLRMKGSQAAAVSANKLAKSLSRDFKASDVGALMTLINQAQPKEELRSQ